MPVSRESQATYSLASSQLTLITGMIPRPQCVLSTRAGRSCYAGIPLIERYLILGNGKGFSDRDFVLRTFVRSPIHLVFRRAQGEFACGDYHHGGTCNRAFLELRTGGFGRAFLLLLVSTVGAAESRCIAAAVAAVSTQVWAPSQSRPKRT